MTTTIIGIDPGSATGGLALMVAGRLTDVRDLPITETRKQTKGSELRDLIGGPTDTTQHQVNAGALADILREWTTGRSAEVFCEEVGVRPSQGIVTTGRFMKGVGIICGVCAALSLPFTPVLPETWKKATNAPNGEREVCQYAAKIFPEWADSFKRVKDNHRAEAVLIAKYGVIQNATS